MRRFKISLSGKGYPAYRPVSMTIVAQDAATAEQWVKKQLSAFKLDPATADIKWSIVEVMDPPAAPKSAKAPKKG